MAGEGGEIVMRLRCLLLLLFTMFARPTQAGPIGSSGAIGQPALLKAALKGDAKRVSLLLAHGTAVDSRSKEGQTALLAVAQRGDVAMMTLLISRGANVNLQDSEGNSVLKLVLSGPADYAGPPVSEDVKRQEMLLLLRHGADVNRKDKDGDTALIMAVIGEPSALAELLVTRGADVNAHGSKGQTALMLAMAFYEGQKAYRRQGASTILTLLGHGTEPNAKDAHGATALFYGVTDQYGTRTVSDVYSTSSNDDKSVADVLKEMPGQSEMEEIEAAHLLLDHGADINAKDQYGKTVLFYAKRENHPRLVAELRRGGALE